LAIRPNSRFNWIHEINHYDERLMARRDPVGSLITRRPTTGRPATRSGKIKAPPGVPAGLISLAVERGGRCSCQVNTNGLIVPKNLTVSPRPHMRGTRAVIGPD
jgi:hypothetical protein